MQFGTLYLNYSWKYIAQKNRTDVRFFYKQGIKKSILLYLQLP